VALHGGMDNQYTLPFGTVDEVRQEVLIICVSSARRRLHSAMHNIQSITPVDNVLAMYDTGYEAGWM
jgi:uroporphyrinogen decarboxylase